MDWKVRFVDYPKLYHGMKEDIDNAISDCLEGGDFIVRKQLLRFESELAEFVNCKYAIGVNSGTDALFLSLKALGISAGDEVITVSHTFVATIAVIVHCGATPILVDVGKDYNMDVSQVERAITKKTRAIMPVHLNGRCCDMKLLIEIADKYHLDIVEDAAQALGAKFSNVDAGGMGTLGAFSFYPAKILGCLGDGGAVVTDSTELANHIRLMRDHMVDKDKSLLGYGYNSRLDNLQASVLSTKLKKLPEWIARRREVAMMYEKGLANIGQVTTPPPPAQKPYYDVYQNYVITATNRDELNDYLNNKCKIETIVSWRVPTHLHHALGLLYSLPETEKISNGVISLPCNTEITDEQVGYVIGCIKKYYE